MPPDGVAARRFLYEELVLGRAAGVLAGFGGQGAGGDDGGLVAADRMLVEGCRAEVAPFRQPSRSAPQVGAAGGGFHSVLCLAGTLPIISIWAAEPPAGKGRVSGDSGAAAAGAAALPAADGVDQDVLAETIGRDEKRPPLVDPGHLVDELGQIRSALKHECVYDDAVACAAPHLAERLLDGLERRRVREVSAAVVLVDVGGRLAVRDHDDLPVPAVLREQRPRELEPMLHVGSVHVVVEGELRQGLWLELDRVVGETDHVQRVAWVLAAD